MASADATILSDLLDPARLRFLGADPDVEALTDGATRWSWNEYLAGADGVARALRSVGVRPGDRVGVRLPKTGWSFVVVHGVLRAGAVMVPVDPLAPADYASHVLADAGIAALVTDHRLRGSAGLVGELDTAVVVPSTSAEWAAGSLSADRWVAVDAAPDPDGGTDRAGAEPTGVSPDDPAYIVYTSGSTGRPKGIVHTHASALAYARAAVDQYAVGPSDRAANVAGLHFDQSTFELYAAPLAGASVVVVPDVALRFPASVVDLLHREATTIWYTVPHVLHQLIERGALAERDWPHVRLVKYGGEAYSPERLTQLMAALPTAAVSNVYGPAEVNQCTAYQLPGPPADSGAIPIGDAWPAAELLVVDPDDAAVVTDVGVGELLVSGPTMMSGYWNRADLTEERITTDQDGRRWYRTGDLVERGSDGLLRFVGRVDNQVKVRGQRVELEAVDAAIVAAPGVAIGLAVVDRNDPAGDAVVAVVVAEEAGTIEGDAERSLLRHLAERLPAAAAPARIVVVSDLPRTTSGKLDRGGAVSLLDTA